KCHSLTFGRLANFMTREFSRFSALPGREHYEMEMLRPWNSEHSSLTFPRIILWHMPHNAWSGLFQKVAWHYKTSSISSENVLASWWNQEDIGEQGMNRL